MAAIHTLSIYKYIDPVKFLNDVLSLRREQGADFTLRSWAKEMGLSRSTALSAILKGERSIPEKFIPMFASSLRLGPTEGKYFEAIVGISHAKTPREQETWMRKARRIYEAVSFEIDLVEDFKFFTNPVLVSLLSLVELKEFRYDVAWIQRRLGADITPAQIQEGFDFLLAQGYVALDSNGKMRRSRRSLWSRKDVNARWSKRMHETVLANAARSMFRSGVGAREFGSNGTLRGDKALHDFASSVLLELDEIGRDDEVHGLEPVRETPRQRKSS
ncbi:MAG: TIGR02147 family protein [Bdellovibrionales bacterium]|nr:TIGR02147 family protein [Bdellovibrionales bacterium]